MKSFFPLLSLACIFAGCQYDPYADQLTTTKPNKADLAGTYIFESETIDSLQTFKDKNGHPVIPEIKILPDGNYEVENLPLYTGSNAMNINTHLLSEKGKWDLSVTGGMDDGKGKEKQTWGIILDGLPEEMPPAGLMNEKPPYKLIFTFGDPDAGDVMIFRRK